MPYFRMSTRLIALCVISLVTAGSVGELILFQGPSLEPSSKPGSTSHRTLVCATEDDGAVLVWNDAAKTLNRSDTSRSHPNCSQTFEGQCRIQWNQKDRKKMGAWKVVDSYEIPNGPVFDYRWEELKPLDSTEAKDKTVYWSIGKTRTTVVSIRRLGHIQASVCLKEQSKLLYCTAAFAWPNKTTVIVPESTGFTKGCQENGSHAAADQFFRYEWQTFIIRFNGSQVAMQLFNSTVPASTVTISCQGRWVLAISGSDSFQIREHKYKYFRTTTNNDTKLSTVPLFHSGTFLCVDLLVSLCSGCDLSVRIVVNDSFNMGFGNISGIGQTAPDQLPTWRHARLNNTMPQFSPQWIRLEISTRAKIGTQHLRWAIDYFRNCQFADAVKETRLNITGIGEKGNSSYPSVSCQKLSHAENLVVKAGVQGVHPNSSYLLKCLQTPTRPICQCGKKYLDSITSICDPSGCTSVSASDNHDCKSATVVLALPSTPKMPTGSSILESPVATKSTGEKPREKTSARASIIIFWILAICLAFLLYIYRRQLLKAVKRARQLDLASHSHAFMNFCKSHTTCTAQDLQSLPVSSDAELSAIVSTPDPSRVNYCSHSVSIKDFENYVKDALASGALKSQFKMLPRGLNKPHYCGSLPGNKLKNRYTNILPYDDSRVILTKTLGDFHSDYINANYVQGFRKRKGYIAAQGPKPQTLVDFWRMIWQEKTLIVCMLANLHENYKVKCEQYWPEYGTSNTYGDILVLTESHQAFADYIIRTFRVSCNGEVRKIRHLHYTGWPDHGVPPYSNSVVSYLKKLLTITIGPGPIVVHCSAGVGRTGTIILSDICLRKAVAKGTVDVLAEFERLRECRMNMVDNDLQYIFVHIVLSECLVSLPTDLPCDNELPQAIERLKKIVPQHMRRLRSICWKDQALQNFQTFAAEAVLPQQLEKNRFPELSPGGNFRIYLQRYPIDDDNSDYISAVFVDGLRIKKQFVASQLPLPSTLPDFWRLIAEQRIELVIILQRPDLDDLTCCNIIPDKEGFDPVPFINVKSKSSSGAEGTPAIDELVLTDSSAKEQRTQQVTVLTCTGWVLGKNGKPPAPEELVQLWIDSENIHRQTGPTLVLCHDGVTGCGLYLALSFVLERMAVERECDIIFAVGAIRRSRTDYVQSRAQFEYLYDAAAKYIECFEDYANFT